MKIAFVPSILHVVCYHRKAQHSGWKSEKSLIFEKYILAEKCLL